MSAIKSALIRPGLLVNLTTRVHGGVTYQRVDLDAAGVPIPADAEGVHVARWETTRIIEDKGEYEAATKVRSKAASLIRRECQETTFGLLCPADREPALDAAIKAARLLVEEHNAKAAHTQVHLYVLKGRVASNDEEAARAITAEIAQLVEQMDQGIAALDAKAIRQAADRAREMAAMLDDSLKGKVEGAIEQARKAARMIVKRIEKEGEDKAIVLADIQRGQIQSARIAFLDLSGESKPADAGEAMPVVEAQRFADLDLSDVEPEEQSKAPAPTKPALDLSDDTDTIAVAAKAASVPMMELA